MTDSGEQGANPVIVAWRCDARQKRSEVPRLPHPEASNAKWILHQEESTLHQKWKRLNELQNRSSQPEPSRPGIVSVCLHCTLQSLAAPRIRATLQRNARIALSFAPARLLTLNS